MIRKKIVAGKSNSTGIETAANIHLLKSGIFFASVAVYPVVQRNPNVRVLFVPSSSRKSLNPEFGYRTGCESTRCYSETIYVESMTHLVLDFVSFPSLRCKRFRTANQPQLSLTGQNSGSFDQDSQEPGTFFGIRIFESIQDFPVNSVTSDDIPRSAGYFRRRTSPAKLWGT